MREKKTYIGFLMILMQRLVTSSTRAIITTLEKRLAVLHEPGEQLSLLPSLTDEEWGDLDGQDQLDSFLKTRLAAMKNERAEVELLPRYVSGMPVPRVRFPSLPGNLSGTWSLWEVSIVTQDRQKRRRY